MTQNKKLVLITIASVQEKISEAVKTSELYANSNSISECIKKIYESIKGRYSDMNFDLVLPMIEENNKIHSFPNYILFTVESDKSSFDFEKEVNDEVVKLNEYDYEIFVSSVEIENDYNESYQKVHGRMNAIKSGRGSIDRAKTNLEIGASKKPGKCIVCGIAEINEENLDSICGRCQGKRKTLSPSTVDVATLEWRAEADISLIKELEVILDKEKSELKDCKANGYYVQNAYSFNNQVKNKLEEINKLVEFEASHYYALIQIDLDDFGKHLSGLYCSKTSALTLKEYQKKLSLELIKFNKKIAEKLEEYSKKMVAKKQLSIYMGGDDLLFFCPVYKIPEILDLVECKLVEINNDLKNEKLITVSRSIVIAHESTPLKKVLRQSSEALKTIKTVYKTDGKNGIAFSLFNTSANKYFSYLKMEKETLNSLCILVKGFKNEIASNFIANLEREFLGLVAPVEFDEHKCLRKLIKSEIRRNLIRKLKSSSEKSIDNYTRTMENLISSMVCRENNRYFIDVHRYFNLLHILQKISAETKSWEVR